jgi:N-glycosylase/DNA lyase
MARFEVREYDLPATLASGQAFRWRFNPQQDLWEGVVQGHSVALSQRGSDIQARTAGRISDWNWLAAYLQLDIDLPAILATFPDDPALQRAVAACQGLRLLRQDPWECLASFILSSSKQIVQIQQIVTQLCECYGAPIAGMSPASPAFAFPAPERLAACSEADLRACKMGFRAPYLLGTAERVASGSIDLNGLTGRSVEHAREELLTLPGVGRKIADCVLLFAYGFQTAFPIDVWIAKALRELYFPRRRKPLTLDQLQKFTARHFGDHAGYAQQYLFHYMRTRPLS